MIEENIHTEASYSVKDDRFTIEKIPDSQLIVELSDSFLHFAVSDPENRMVWLEDFPLYPQSKIRRIKQLFNDHPLLSVRFWKTIKILIHSSKKCFIPSNIEPEEAKEILKLLYKKDVSDTMITSVHDGGFVFEAEPELITFLEDFYPEKEVKIELAESFLRTNTLIFHQLGLTLVLIQNGINTYFSSSFEKFIPILKEKNIQDLQVCGEVTGYALEFKQLSGRFSGVKLAEKNQELTFSQYFQDCPMHRYYLLFAAAL
ncbi:DUF3822 family protein [Jiulongibacter sediminis]|uniref:DUF3822 family protein n=1 Tax=Jiulongibacter sediminis TaxID=1605367 RepID=UPI0026F083BF|nr:DUF3822 family protein [Jiulongibacter sediminis]